MPRGRGEGEAGRGAEGSGGTGGSRFKVRLEGPAPSLKEGEQGGAEGGLWVSRAGLGVSEFAKADPVAGGALVVPEVPAVDGVADRGDRGEGGRVEGAFVEVDGAILADTGFEFFAFGH